MHTLRPTPILRALAGLALMAGAAAAAAHDDGAAETVRPLMRQALADVPGRQVTLLTVTYEPGQSSSPHLHPGSVLAYVLEGSVESQLAGEPLRTYTQGQFWYEGPRAHHLVSRNASRTAPAKLVVWLLGGENEAVKQPLP
ncbi:MAG: cupin domain-containing protein [Rhodocyclaceae bacterium]|nr:cupin domain-containing protein [Rhodocyclaceae bacterium]